MNKKKKKKTEAIPDTDQSLEMRIRFCESVFIHETVPYPVGLEPTEPDAVPCCFDF